MAIQNSALVLDSDWELVTSRIHSFIIHVLKESILWGMDVRSLDGYLATAGNFRNEVNAKDPAFLVLVGHGKGDALGGFRNDIILDTSMPLDILKNRIIFAFSCSTAKELGPAAVDNGATAYLGFTEDYELWFDTTKSSLNDNLARGSISPALEFVRSIYNGRTTGEALANTIKAFNSMIEFWKTVNRPEASFLIGSLLANRDSLVLLGTTSARVSTPHVSLRSILKSVLFT